MSQVGAASLKNDETFGALGKRAGQEDAVLQEEACVQGPGTKRTAGRCRCAGGQETPESGGQGATRRTLEFIT